MKYHSLVVGIYAALIIIGGFIGYIKAQSHMSLIMGVGAGTLLFISAAGIYYSQGWGLLLAFLLTGLLMFFFGYRFYTTQLFLPAGLMTTLSVLSLLFLSFLPRK